jgi:hypothetical protein
MELRRLLTPIEIDQFRAGLTYSRQKVVRFRETEASRVGEIHLRFGMVYGLYDTTSFTESVDERMLGGITLHSLADYGLTHPVSALDNLPPSAVFEGSQLWSTSYEAALALKLGFMLLAALYGARALVAFPIISPRDTSALHRHFQRIGAPFEIPFVVTSDREKVWAQTMVLQGAALYKAMYSACVRGFATRDAHTRVRLSSASEVAVLCKERAEKEDLDAKESAVRSVDEPLLVARL